MAYCCYMLLIIAFLLCGGLADGAIQCKQCADIKNITSPMNATDDLPTCHSASPTPCNGTAFGCAEFNGKVSYENLNGTTNATIKYQYCTTNRQTSCYRYTNTNVINKGNSSINDTSGLSNAFSEETLDPAKLGFGLGQPQGINGRVCTHGFQSPAVVSGQNKLFPSVVILLLALICH
ncbi:uncharacterized protein [Mytilus edulis]|uniref:uncharacterized protein n=1 Tax=Mytilus edulis TaxID=6550 RepID=UPI0039EE3C3E